MSRHWPQTHRLISVTLWVFVAGMVGAAEPEETTGVAEVVAEPVSWQRHVVPASTVSVTFPGEVETRIHRKRTVAGLVVSNTLVAEYAGGWIAATVTDPPAALFYFISDETVLRHARNNILKDSEGTEISYQPVVRGGRGGRALAFSTLKDTGKPQIGQSEIYSFDGLVVTFTAVAHSEAPEGLALTFLESVRWE